ncbi:MAG TPA: tryptophanase [Candidatus Binatia bacterium]|jgi:tyrosine phenol-lyase
MNDLRKDIGFSVPYDIAVARILRPTSREEREAALAQASYNTELVPQQMVYVDLQTDSGISALSTAQAAALIGSGVPEAVASGGRDGAVDLSRLFEEIFGFPFVVPCVQGRAAERIWTKLNIREGTVVPGNMLFPSTRYHIEANRAKVVDVISETAYDLFSNDPFKGNLDLRKLAGVVSEQGAEKVSCIYVELAVNSCGGHPVSLANLKDVRSFAQSRKIPLFLDACRILENSYLIQRREPGCGNLTIQEIVRETCALADGLTMSALKDFLVPIGGFIGMRDEKSYQKASFQQFLDGGQPPAGALAALALSLGEIFSSPTYVQSRVEQVNTLWQRLNGAVPVLRPAAGHGVFIDAKSFLPAMPPEEHPAEALAAFIYAVSGIRVTKGPPLTRQQIERGMDLLRLAVPARRYLQGHMDDVAEAVLYAYSHRDEIRGLKQVEKPGRSKYDPPLFTPAA